MAHARKLSCRGKCVRNQPLVDKDKILLPPLYIRLGLMKNFIKAMYLYDKGFEYLKEKFPNLRDSNQKKASLVECNFLKSVHMIYLNTCWRFIFYIPTCISSLRTWAQWAMNTGKDSTRIFPPWTKDMQENRQRTC